MAGTRTKTISIQEEYEALADEIQRLAKLKKKSFSAYLLELAQIGVDQVNLRRSFEQQVLAELAAIRATIANGITVATTTTPEKIPDSGKQQQGKRRLRDALV